MAKKYLTAKERKKRRNTVVLCALGALALLAAVLITVGVCLGRKADEEEKISYEYLKSALEDDYRDHPWDEKDADSVERKEGLMWAVFEAFMTIEDNGMKNGSKGIEYDRSAGNTLCFDLTSFDEETQRALEKLFADYCEKKKLTFRTGTMASLKAEGKINGNEQPDVYTEGCLISISSDYDDYQRAYFTEIFFYYNSRYGRGARVISVRSEDLAYYTEEVNGEQSDDIFVDGELWTNYLIPGLIT